MSPPNSDAPHQGQSRHPNLPVYVGLCPVHLDEFYVPVNHHDGPGKCPEPGCEEDVRLYVTYDLLREETALLSRAASLLESIKAVCDEPLDERRGRGPTRSKQFARIDDLIRDYPKLPDA